MSSEPNSPDKQKAKTYFDYGNDAALKSNFDYAIDMYKAAAKIDVNNLVYRQALRGIERRKFNNDPGKVGMLVGAKNQPILLRARHARSKQRYAEAIEHCEDAFVNNPWDVGAARIASESAENLDHLVLAEWFVESVETITKDVDYLKYAARVHEANESWAKAIACWEKVKKLHPNDQDANRQINALSASSTIKRAKLDDALDDHRAAAATKEPAESMEAKLERLKHEQLSPEQRLVKEIIADPKAVHAYLDLADIYRRHSDFDKAEKVLSRGLKANPNDQALQAVYEDTQISRLKRGIESQSQRVLQHPEDTGAKVKLDQLTEMYNKYEVEAFRRRAKLHADDPGVHLQLGKILARVGDHDGAIASFQQARTSALSTVKIDALYQSGLSFEANGAYKLAERNFRDALKLIEPDDQTMFLALHYQLGCTSESLGNNEAAEEHLNEVAAIDYSYRDVAQRLKRLL
jgi:tetratricopeptide (TPR) repeat protein